MSNGRTLGWWEWAPMSVCVATLKAARTQPAPDYTDHDTDDVPASQRFEAVQHHAEQIMSVDPIPDYL